MDLDQQQAAPDATDGTIEAPGSGRSGGVGGGERFRLLRYFSATSAAVLALALVALILLYRTIATNELVRLTEHQNVALAQSFANVIWKRFQPFVDSVAGLDGDALRARPETAELHDALKTLTADFPVLKVKIYNRGGLTVYASALNEIGVDKSTNSGFLRAAREHRPATKMSHRGTFSAFSGVLYKRDIVETYIPIPRHGPIEGVFELYTDVTTAVAGIDHATRVLAFGLIAAFGILYASLYLIVRRADRIMRRQYQELEQSKDVIDDKNRALEREIATRQNAERQLAHQYKLRSLGDFAGGLAHNLLNLLQPIRMLSEQVRDALAEDSAERKKLAVINTASIQGAELVNRIRLFSREGEIVTESFDMADLVRETLDLVSATLPSKITLVTDISTDAGSLTADRAQLQTVILNLASNAVQAIGDETGEVRVTLAMADIGPPGRSVPGLAAGRYVRLTVADSGTGMDERTLERVFDPFFTTKGIGEGTGLGLSTAYGIVRRHEGVITADSHDGGGATFQVYLPLGPGAGA